MGINGPPMVPRPKPLQAHRPSRVVFYVDTREENNPWKCPYCEKFNLNRDRCSECGAPNNGYDVEGRSKLLDPPEPPEPPPCRSIK